MSEIAKAKPLNHLDSTTLTVTDTFRETFSYDDEEGGYGPSRSSSDVSTTQAANKSSQESKKRAGWIIAGAILIFILGLSIGLATRSNGEGSTAATPTAAIPKPSVPVEDGTAAEVAAVPKPDKPNVPTVVLDINEDVSISSDDVDVDSDEPIFEPAEPVGDSALLNPSLLEPVETSTLSTSSSSANKPVLSEPIINVIASPTMSPSPVPSKEPTSEPSAEPTKAPTNEVRMGYK